jgi:nucleoside 2-deoxyribosyltransferase
MTRIYCAGPLFNQSERSEMAEIARVLEEAGHTTFLPHRDGLEFARLMPELRLQGLDAERADKALQRAIFSLDVYQLLKGCDAVVANINGRVPDEGTVVEAALAWLSGKPLVLYKADARALLDGADNPMLAGLSNFEVLDNLAALPQAVARELSRPHGGRVAETLRIGEQIAHARAESAGLVSLATVLAKRFEPA